MKKRSWWKHFDGERPYSINNYEEEIPTHLPAFLLIMGFLFLIAVIYIGITL